MINAFCENTPSQLLRYLHSGGDLPGRWTHEIPSRRSSGQKPLSAAFSGNLQQKYCSDSGSAISIEVRQSSREAIKDRVIQIRRHNARPICGEPNLLLVMPAFRQFACSVKPVQGLFFSCPTDSECGRSKRVERLVKTGALLTSRLHHVDQDQRAKTAVDGYAFRVQTIHQCDYILR